MRLILIFAGQIGFMGAMGVAAALGLAYQENKSAEAMAMAISAGRAEIAFKTEIQEWKNILIRGTDPVLFKKYNDGRLAEAARVDKHLNDILGRNLAPDLRERIRELQRNHGALLKEYNEVLVKTYRGTTESALATDFAVRGRDRAITEEFSAVADAFFVGEEKENHSARVLMSAAMAVLVLIFGLIGGFLAWATIQSIQKPLTLFSGGMSQLAVGDFTFAAKLKRQDEFGALANDVNKAVDHVGSVVRQAAAASHELAATSEQLLRTSQSFSQTAQNQASSAEEIAATMEQIEAGIENVSTVSQAQSAEMARFAEAFRTLASQIQSADKQMGSALQSARESAGTAVKGEEALRQMDLNMGRIRDGSGRIKSITDEVIGISERVDLLSLNASIEAARAGDAGRGFAVVATEIARLSEQTAKTVDEIARITGDNEKDVHSGASTLKEVTDVLSQLTKTIRDFQEIIQDVSSTMNKQQAAQERMSADTERARAGAESVKAALAEQRAAIMEVVRAVTSISEMTQANARGAQELSSGSQRVAEIAETIQKNMSFFKTRER